MLIKPAGLRRLRRRRTGKQTVLWSLANQEIPDRNRSGQGSLETGSRAGTGSRNIGGADGIRTHDPLNAIQVLFQLSYSPTLKSSETGL